MRRVTIIMLLLSCVVPVVFRPAAVFADAITNARVQCHVEYGDGSEMRACEHGLELASRAGLKDGEATDACTRDSDDAASVAACQRGVALHARLAARRGEGAASSFSHTLNPRRGAAQVDIGDYRLHVGDAEKSIEDCLRAYEGSSTPPSCLSGLTVQHKPSSDTAPK